MPSVVELLNCILERKEPTKLVNYCYKGKFTVWISIVIDSVNQIVFIIVH